MFAIEMLLAGVERLFRHTFRFADLGHAAPALRLDEDLRLVVLLRADGTSEEIIGTEIPFAVPTVLLHRLFHRRDMLRRALRLVFLAEIQTELGIVLAAHTEESGDHQRLRLRALRLVLGRLERLVRIVREAVEVEAVIPVRAADERQLVGT